LHLKQAKYIRTLEKEKTKMLSAKSVSNANRPNDDMLVVLLVNFKIQLSFIVLTE